MQTSVETAVAQHLSVLAQQIGARPTGSSGNQQAGAYLRDQFAAAGWAVETPTFPCKTWTGGAARLTLDGASLAVQANPYSPPLDGEAPVVVCRDWPSLHAHTSLAGRFVVLTGDLASFQYLPKQFPFLTLDDQQAVIAHLERARPEAVIGVYPSPLFCDADFAIPSVTLDPRDEARLLAGDGRRVRLNIAGETVDSTGFNVIARRGSGERRVIVCAHYDTWFDTPGALDNGGGVAALLGLAALMGDSPYRVELVAFNGEDHYASPGEVDYLAQDLSDVALVINMDGIGAAGHANSIAYFIEDAALLARVKAIHDTFPELVEVEPWPQSDHMPFVMRGLPALALCSTGMADLSLVVSGTGSLDAEALSRVITHTAADTVDIVSAAKLAEAAAFVSRLLAV